MGAFALYAGTACRTVFLGDSGELVAAAAGLGVAHPPGYPLWTLVARASLAFPVGEPAFRVGLLSALCGAAACALVAAWVLRATASLPAALGAGFLLAATDVVWASSTVAEVYAPHLLIVLALLEAARRFGVAEEAAGARRASVAAAALLGTGLAHHPTIVLVIPAAAVLAWPGRKRANARVLVLSGALAAAIPVAAYASLLPRALAHPEASWGTLRNLRDVVAHAGADLYRPYDLGWAGALRPDAWRALFDPLVWGTGGLGAAVALWGVFRALRGGDKEARREAAALAVLVVAASVFSLRYGVEDVDSYLVPAAAALAILAGRGLAALQGPARRARALAWAGAAVVIALALVRNAPAHDLRTITAAADYGRDMLATLPQGALLVADGDDTFTVAYLQRVMGERTDAEVYDRDGFVLRDVSDDPGFPPAPGEPVKAWRGRRLAAVVTASVLGPSPRPVLFMSRPRAPISDGIDITPYGILFRAGAPGTNAPDDAPLWRQYREKEIAVQARRVGGRFAAAVAASYAMMRAEGALHRGDQAVAYRALDEAAATAPQSETIRNGVGAIYGRLGLYARAIGEFEAAVAAKPASQRAWANLAMARELAGDRAGAASARARLRELQAR